MPRTPAAAPGLQCNSAPPSPYATPLVPGANGTDVWADVVRTHPVLQPTATPQVVDFVLDRCINQSVHPVFGPLRDAGSTVVAVMEDLLTEDRSELPH